MGPTLAEKIIGEYAARDVTAGEIVVATLDPCYVQDGIGPLAVCELNGLGRDRPVLDIVDSGALSHYVSEQCGFRK